MMIFSLAARAEPVANGADAAPWAPESHPDPEWIETRARIVVEGVADGGLAKWRRGYFAGGDPGKYLPGHAMAKLLLNPDDPEPVTYMNDNRSFKEHYHFAAVNWARFWPLFGEDLLTDETRAKFAERQKRYNYLSPGGTENHKTMWWTSANVLPHFTGAGTNHKSKAQTLRDAKEILRDYVKGLFMAGQGEWDSSTYLMFDINGLLNIYDFSPDEESRLLARAGLDYLIGAYALKYTDGVFTAPNQRGFASGPYASIADQTGYIWWGGNRELTAADTRGFRYAIHPVTSDWRPGRVITHIATRNVEGLPAEQRNSKANYWHGQGLPPRPGASHETVYLHPRFTMGSLWDQHASQHTRFMLTVSTKEGGVVFSGGHPRKSDHNDKKIGIGFKDGTGRYVQSAQSGPVYLCMVRAPEDEEHDYAYFTVPEEFGAPRDIGAWKVFDVEGVHVAVRPLLGGMEMGATPADKRGNTRPMLKFPGRDSGFVVWALEDGEKLEDKLASVRIGSGAFTEHGRVAVVVPDVTTIEARFHPNPNSDNHGTRAAEVKVDGEIIDLSAWPIYSGPFVTQTPGVVTLSDGRESFTIDFTGDLPVYRE